MKRKTIRKRKWFSPTLGAVLTALCGLVLWHAPFAEGWVNASYDYLFLFGSRHVTNQVVVIQMDNDSYDYFRQSRSEPRWDRELHARLLDKLADDGCALVVFDSFFRAPRDKAKDAALAKAIQRQRGAVLMAWQADTTYRNVAGERPVLPDEAFLVAARTNWGVAWFDPDLDTVVRKHWPFPSSGEPYPSLPWTAARLTGVSLSDKPVERWLRYYGAHGAWQSLSYRIAMDQPANFFRDKIVFIGNAPRTTVPGDEEDEFRTPYNRWRSESMAGVQINVTAFLNLVNRDWLRRPSPWLEALVFIVVGSLLGGFACRMRPLKAGVITIAFGLTVAFVGISGSHFSNFWFPWLVISGGQVPCALAWALAVQLRVRKPTQAAEEEPAPETPGYELFHPPFGKGAYGKVWLARNSNGQWEALKVVYRAKFGGDPNPYEREFNGIQRYRPFSDKHSGLLRVDFVSEKLPDGFFYYVMELGDPQVAGWERNPSTYKPRDLISECGRMPGRKLPVRECVKIGIMLADALEFLHQRGLTHRDIKPQNIIFVSGQPKLADMGLIAEIRPPDQTRTYVGTPGYMPPAPELPGTPQADIYALGMLLYVTSTGRNPTFFPELSTSLAETTLFADFFPLNAVILKACQPVCAQRYQSAAEMRAALLEVQKQIEAKGALHSK